MALVRRPKSVYKYRMQDLRHAVAARVAKAPGDQVWTPVDFLDLGSRAAVDKVPQRPVQQGQLRRTDHRQHTSTAVSMTYRVSTA